MSRKRQKNTYQQLDNGTTLVHCVGGRYFIIDTTDLPLVSSRQWCMEKDGYAKSRTNGEYVTLHRLLMGVTDSGHRIRVDHISGDATDNRRSNLRICTAIDNSRNSRLRSNNKTGFKGVCYVPKKGKYCAYISDNCKTKNLGYFETAQEAAAAYDKAALLIYGDYARTNAMLGLYERLAAN